MDQFPRIGGAAASSRDFWGESRLNLTAAFLRAAFHEAEEIEDPEGSGGGQIPRLQVSGRSETMR